MERSASTQEKRTRSDAHILQGPCNLTIQNIPLEVFTPAHVQIRIHSVGLSSSDLNYYETGSHYGRTLTSPLILGKEATGEITVVGSNVSLNWPDVRVGSRVVIEPGLPCRMCQRCISGKYNVCVNIRTAAYAGREPFVHGFLRQHVNWPGEMVHLLPDNVSYDLATLAEPLARVIHATRRLNLQPSSSVAVLGSGLLSLLTCAFAKSLNCYPICIIDTDQTRMNIAKTEGWASHSYTVPPPPPPGTPSHNLFYARKALAHSILRELQAESGYQTVFEITGSETGIQLAIFLAERAGKIAQMNGVDLSTHAVPRGEAINREIDLISCYGYAGTFPAALTSLASGSLGNVISLLTHKLPFVRAEEGFRRIRADKDVDGKPVIRVLVSPPED